MPEDNQNNDSNSLTKKQKWAVLGLSIFAVVVVSLWGWQLKSSLINPLMPSGVDLDSSAEEGSTCLDGNCNQTDDLALYMQDTDNDGLSDWEELNIYFTSPYLEDSDSDGYSDFEEIQNNKDPNCPAGQNCYNVNIASEDVVAEDDIPSEEDLLQGFLSGNVDTKTLRELFLEYGMDEELLNQVSDEELLVAFQETLEEEENFQSNSDEAVFQEFLSGDVDAETLRALFLEYGMDEEFLNTISDEELLETYKEILK